MNLSKRTTKTLIMKGGGVKGLAFAGAIDELEKAGFKFNTFVGTSAGAVAAVFLAAGYSASELNKILSEKSFRDLMSPGWPRSWWNLLTSGGLYDGKALTTWVRSVLRRKFPDTNRLPEILMKHLGEQGNRALVFAAHPVIGTLAFDSGGSNDGQDVAYAVRMSSSIPGFFVPASYGERRIYDGGLLHNFPVEVYERIRREGGADQSPDFIALYIGTPDRGDKKRWWFLEALHIMLARDDTVVLQSHHKRSITINTHPISTTDFDLTDREKEYLVEVGRCAALNFLGSNRHKESMARVDALRERVLPARRKRKFLHRCRSAALVLLLVASAGGAVKLLSRPPQYWIQSSPTFQSTYVNYGGVISQLSDPVVNEVLSTSKNFDSSYTRGGDMTRSCG